MFCGSFVCQSRICPCTVGFCIALCVVSALNSPAIQSKACISIAKYKHWPVFWKPWWNYFQINFIENKNEMRKKWKYSDFSKKKALLFVFSFLKCTLYLRVNRCELCMDQISDPALTLSISWGKGPHLFRFGKGRGMCVMDWEWQIHAESSSNSHAQPETWLASVVPSSVT